MTLPASGLISLSQVNTELGAGSTTPISLNDTAVRTLFGKPSGIISMSDGWGKSSASGTFGFNPNLSYVDAGGTFNSGTNGTSSGSLSIYTNGTLSCSVNYITPPIAGVGSAYSARFVTTVSMGGWVVFNVGVGNGYDSGYVPITSTLNVVGTSYGDYAGGYVEGTLYIRRNSDGAVISIRVGFSLPSDS